LDGDYKRLRADTGEYENGNFLVDMPPML